jgi:hypothetical protein
MKFDLNPTQMVKAEVGWLKNEVYGGKKARIEIEVHNCLTRFSNRTGNRAVREICVATTICSVINIQKI